MFEADEPFSRLEYVLSYWGKLKRETKVELYRTVQRAQLNEIGPDAVVGLRRLSPRGRPIHYGKKKDLEWVCARVSATVI